MSEINHTTRTESPRSKSFISAWMLIVATCVAAGSTYLQGGFLGDRATIVGSLVAGALVYLVAGLAGAKSAGIIWRKSDMPAHIGYCLFVVGLFAMIQIGDMRMTTYANDTMGSCISETDEIEHTVARGAQALQGTPGVGHSEIHRSRLDSARFNLLKASTDEADHRMAVGVILRMFSRGEAWAEIDQIAGKQPPGVYRAYLEFKKSAIDAGYNPIWTAKEQMARDNQLQARDVIWRFKVENNRYPNVSELTMLRTNPFTKSNRVAEIWEASMDYGWVYLGDSLGIRAIIPLGERCRSIPCDEIIVLDEQWLDRAVLVDEAN